MPRKTKQKKGSSANLGFEATLWAAAHKPRNNMDAAEYKHVVLGLIFLKYISDAFEGRRRQILTESSDPSSQWFIRDASAGFSGQVSVNPLTGAVSIQNATPAGTHTITVSLTARCSPPVTRTFSLSVVPIASPVITASGVYPLHVQVSWPPVNGAARYTVYRRSDVRPFLIVGSTPVEIYVDGVGINPDSACHSVDRARDSAHC